MSTALLCIRQVEPDATVAFFPSDHYYSNDHAFQCAVRSAVGFANARPESIILLGGEAHTPEIEYGWIEPSGVIVDAAPTQIHRVSRFWEKPSGAQAQRLLRAGCLWNTFVTIGVPERHGCSHPSFRKLYVIFAIH